MTGMSPMRSPRPPGDSESPLEPTRNIEYRVDAEKLDRQDFQRLSRDREVKAIARPMPLRLIAPVSHSGPAAGQVPIHGATWGVYVTGALQSPYVGHGVTVAILDTGIKADHEAFRGIELIQKDFTGEGNGDNDGHGTHVAGTIFGQTLHGVRYAVAPGVRRALIGKVLGKERSATTGELVNAVQWAVKEGAQIINMSLGIDFPGLVQLWVKEMGPEESDLATSRAGPVSRQRAAPRSSGEPAACQLGGVPWRAGRRRSRKREQARCPARLRDRGLAAGHR